jgi:hypothetical protein
VFRSLEHHPSITEHRHGPDSPAAAVSFSPLLSVRSPLSAAMVAIALGSSMVAKGLGQQGFIVLMKKNMADISRLE